MKFVKLTSYLAKNRNQMNSHYIMVETLLSIFIKKASYEQPNKFHLKGFFFKEECKFEMKGRHMTSRRKQDRFNLDNSIPEYKYPALLQNINIQNINIQNINIPLQNINIHSLQRANAAQVKEQLLYWSSRHLSRAAVSWLLSQLRSSAAAAVLSTVYFDQVCVFPAARVLVSFLRELPAAAHSPSALHVAASFVRLDGGLFTLIQGQPVNQGSNFFFNFFFSGGLCTMCSGQGGAARGEKIIRTSHCKNGEPERI